MSGPPASEPPASEPPASDRHPLLELCCEVCGDSFPFTRGEERFFRDRGLDLPKRCPTCREARRKKDPGRPALDYEDDPEARPCDACGALTRVPFKPTSERPVYCERCFSFR